MKSSVSFLILCLSLSAGAMNAPASANYGKYSRDDGVGYEEALRQNPQVAQDAELFYIKLQEGVKDKKKGIESKEGMIYEAWQASGISDARAFAFELFYYIKKTYPLFSFEGGNQNTRRKKLSSILKTFVDSVSSKKLVSAKEKKDIQKQLLTLITTENENITGIMSHVNNALLEFNQNQNLANDPQGVINSIKRVTVVMAQAAESISLRHFYFQLGWNQILEKSEAQSLDFFTEMSDFYTKHDDMVKIFQNHLGFIQTMLLTKIVPCIDAQAYQIRFLNREILGFQQTIRAQGDEINGLRNEVNGLRNEVEYIKQVKAALSDENQQLNSDKEVLFAQCDDLINNYNDLIGEYNELAQKYETSESIMNKMIAAQKKDEEYRKELEQEFPRLMKDLDAKDAAINAKDAAIKKKDAAIKAKDAAIKEKDAAIKAKDAAAEKFLKEVDSAMKSLKQKLDSAIDHSNQIEKELSNTKIDLEAALEKQKKIKEGIIQAYCQSGKIVHQNELCHRGLSDSPNPRFFPRNVLRKIADSLTKPFKDGDPEEYIDLRWRMYYALPSEVKELKLLKEETLEDERMKDLDDMPINKVFGAETTSAKNLDDEKYEEFSYTSDEKKLPLEYRYRVLTPEEEDAVQDYNSKKLTELKVRRYPIISDEIAKQYDLNYNKNLFKFVPGSLMPILLNNKIINNKSNNK